MGLRVECGVGTVSWLGCWIGSRGGGSCGCEGFDEELPHCVSIKRDESFFFRCWCRLMKRRMARKPDR